MNVASLNLWGEPPQRTARAKAAGVSISRISPAVVFMQEVMNPYQTQSFLKGLSQGGDKYRILRGVMTKSKRRWWCWVPTLVLLLLLLLICVGAWVFPGLIIAGILVAVLAALLAPPVIHYLSFKSLGIDFKSQLAFAVREPLKVLEVFPHHSFDTKAYPRPSHPASPWSWLVWWFAETALSPGFAAVKLEVPTPIGQQTVLCYNVHLTPGRQNPAHTQQGAEMLQHLMRHSPPQTSIIVAGDFNDTSVDSLVGRQLRAAGFQLQSCGKPTWTHHNALTSQGAFGNPDADGDIDQIWTRGWSAIHTDVLTPQGEPEWSDHYAPWANLAWES